VVSLVVIKEMSAYYISAGLVIGALTGNILGARTELATMRIRLDKLEQTMDENKRKINLNSDSIDIIRKSVIPQLQEEIDWIRNTVI